MRCCDIERWCWGACLELTLVHKSGSQIVRRGTEAKGEDSVAEWGGGGGVE